MHDQPLAYMDRGFLESDDARPIRILAEYLEPLRRFRDQNIQDTVVFFGSARVHSRVKAERALQKLRSGKRGPDYAVALKRSRKAVQWSRYYEDARELAKQLLDLKPMDEWGAINAADLELMRWVDSPEQALEQLRGHLMEYHLVPETAQENRAPGIAKTRG